MKVVISGATGFLGRPLVASLVRDGHEVVVLSRGLADAQRKLGPQVTVRQWDARGQGPWAAEIDGADAVVHLAGESVGAKRWTAAQKQRILDSRVESGHALVEAIRAATTKPSVLVSASGVDYYAEQGNAEVVESDPSGDDFLARVCVAWEGAVQPAAELGVRVACLRTGIVLGEHGGALERMLTPYRFFVGGPLGSGRQWVPWIHVDDVVGLYRFVLDTPTASGPINATAPNPVRMSEFARTLGKVLGRPSLFPVPAFVLGAVVGEFAYYLVTGKRAVPRKAEELGYRFQYPTVEGALRAVLGQKPAA